MCLGRGGPGRPTRSSGAAEESAPLLREPLRTEHVKDRLLGHWGASPALSFVYTHLNRVIRAHQLDILFMAGPGHGAPGVLGPVNLEGTYSEVYPDKSLAEEGLRRFFKQFSFPGGVGSHCTPETPGSIHEGGELGNVLSHACGAAFDNPDLIVAAVVGDGESETGPLATSWHVNKFLNPIRDGAVLPVLSLNGYKHRLAYRRRNHPNLHVRGYKERGSINTPLELAIENQIDRFSLAQDVIDRVPRLRGAGARVKERFRNRQIQCRLYAHEHGVDPAEIVNWCWPARGA
jgi:phosphoketolase